MGSLLITGASGYIGSKLAQYYCEKREDVKLLVRNPAKLLPELKQLCHVIEGDITRTESSSDVFKGVESVINCAGLLGHWGLTYRDLTEVNVAGALNLIQSSFKAEVRRFIHLSAGGVTGPVGRSPADETYLPKPSTDYEKTKWEGEKRALEEAKKGDLNLLILRPTFTYGPGDPHKLNLFRAVKTGRFAFIGDGYSTVHPVYIDDLVTGIDLALHSDLKCDSLIVGGPQPVTKRELVYGIADTLQVRRPTMKLHVFLANILAANCEALAKVFRFNPPLTKSRVLALSCNWGYSIQRAQDKLGYHPKIQLEEGLRETVSWYREHGWL